MEFVQIQATTQYAGFRSVMCHFEQTGFINRVTLHSQSQINRHFSTRQGADQWPDFLPPDLIWVIAFITTGVWP